MAADLQDLGPSGHRMYCSACLNYFIKGFQTISEGLLNKMKMENGCELMKGLAPFLYDVFFPSDISSIANTVWYFIEAL